MVAHNTNPKDITNPIPAVETRRDELVPEPHLGSLWHDAHIERPWLAQYHLGKPVQVSHPQQRLGVGGTPPCLHRPGRGRR